MVIQIKPTVMGHTAGCACPVCAFENVIRLSWVPHSALEAHMYGTYGHFVQLWDHPQTGICQHLKKYVVEKDIIVFVEDWELSAIEMGAQIFQFPYMDGVPEDNLLRQCRQLLSWRNNNPQAYYDWLKWKRGA